MPKQNPKPGMDRPRDFQLISVKESSAVGTKQKSLALANPGASPFKVVIDPEMRMTLKRALIELIDYHDEALAEHFADCKLVLVSYYEFI